jgi:hypothetical protein
MEKCEVAVQMKPTSGWRNEYTQQPLNLTSEQRIWLFLMLKIKAAKVIANITSLQNY